MSIITSSRYSIRAPREVYGAAEGLAQNFRDPQSSLAGIYELLINAIEHGNLAIGFEEKSMLLQNGRWPNELARRMALRDNLAKKVHITVSHTAHVCSLVIADDGNGFEWRRQLDVLQQDNETAGRRPHGRGLRVALSSGFDRLTFNRIGNRVTLFSRFD